MASLPPRQAASTSQRRQSPSPAPENTPSQPPEHTPSQPQSTQRTPSPIRSVSEDSQTLVLPNQDGDSHTTTSEEHQRHSHEATRPALLTRTTSVSAKKCWICFSDSTEDTPTTSPWRDPCPCALVAHEDCLLDWIADLEAPNNPRSRSQPARIECPQCKAEIKLSRPRSLIVDAVRGLERATSQLITPGSLTVLAGSVYHLSMTWGIHSIYAIFGADDGFRILRPLVLNTIRPRLDLSTATAKEIGDRFLGVAVDHLVHWRLYVGLPLITPLLVLSRTHVADSVLPVLPILFFATQSPTHETWDMATWPPSASLAFSLLPYLRSGYNFYYAKVWEKREKEWLKAIQPRLNQNTETTPGAAEADAQERENVFEVRIDGGIWEEWEREGIIEEVVDEDQVPAADEPPPMQFPNVPEAAPAPDVPDNRAQNAAAQPAGGDRGERRLSFSPQAIAETVLGAMIFPTMAGLSGEILRLALPLAWTTAGKGRAKGLLQEKWGRSLVGGCLFVVLKDAVMLYVRWKMASMHKSRKVVDYDRSQGTAKGK